MAPEEMQSFIFLPIVQHEKNVVCEQLKSVILQQNSADITSRFYCWDIINSVSMLWYLSIEYLNISKDGQCSVAPVE